MKKAGELDKRMKALSLDSAAARAVANIDDARRRLRLYEDSLIPKTERTYESVQDAYSAGVGASFLDLLDTVRELLDIRLEQLRAVRDLQIAAAELELLTAGPCNPMTDGPQAQ